MRAFQKPGASITHNATWLEAIYQMTCSYKRLYTFSFTCGIVLPKTPLIGVKLPFKWTLQTLPGWLKPDVLVNYSVFYVTNVSIRDNSCKLFPMLILTFWTLIEITKKTTKKNKFGPIPDRVSRPILDFNSNKPSEKDQPAMDKV